MPTVHVSGRLVPAFADLQVYGAGSRLLSAWPEPVSVEVLQSHAADHATVASLPTVATNSEVVIHSCIDAVRTYRQQGGRGIPGIHLEGPWINPEKKGAHLESFIYSPSITQVKRLLDYGKDVIRIITLAPEVCSAEIIQLILDSGVLVSAGHSNASYEQAMSFFDQGLPLATHLYNAMSPLQHRAPGLAGAVMDHPVAMASIIPDGHHVDFAAIRIAKHAMDERLFVITDAVTDTDSGPYLHQLAGDKYEAAGILSGSALTMDKAVANLIGAGITDTEALRMCSLYPARAARLDHFLGKIEKGYTAAMAIVDENWQAQGLTCPAPHFN